MQLPESWIRTALRITGHFEDSADPLGGVSGDFDGMGISLGVLQWNIGSGSLQPLVKKVGQQSVVTLMQNCGPDMWTACNSTISKGLSIVRGWQNGQKLKPNPRAELKSFTHGDAFVAQQIAAANHVAQTAFSTVVAWNTEAGLGDPTVQDFCWFFDVITQNGGMKNVRATDVKNFIQASGANKADDVICDWLAARTQDDAGYKDSRKNAQLWRNSVPDDRLLLFAASYLRSQKSNLAWRADTLNRKATIALGTGWVHLEKHNLDFSI